MTAARRETRDALLVLALYATLVALVFLSQSSALRLQGTGAIASPRDLAVELHDREAPGAWTIGEWIPYRYRWLFRALVLLVGKTSSWFQTAEGFYALFIGASALSLLGTSWAFDVLLRRLGFSTREAAAGVVLFLLGFPIVFAYDMPIHTREDMLEYAVFTAALIAVVADRPIATALLTFLAANVREMGLLAAAPFFFVSRRPLRVRLAVIGAATLGTLAITSIRDLAPKIPWYLDRSVWKPDQYKTSVNAPGEAALYVFVCFGALWVAAFLGARHRKEKHDLLGRPTAFLGVAAALVSSIVLGQVREVRTVYLAFPWVVALALEHFRRPEAWADLRRPAARVAGGLVLIAGLLFLWRVVVSPEFVKSVRSITGESFQPGFEAPHEYVLVSDAGVEETVKVYPYTASPWNGVWLVGHAAFAAALIAGEVARRLEERRT